MNKKTFPVLTAMALSASGAMLAGGISPAEAHNVVKPNATAFAMSSSGYASRVEGGQVPAGSDRSAFQTVSCTNLGGQDRTNSEATVDLGPITLSLTNTHAWTETADGVTSSYATHSIADVELVGTGLATVSLTGVSSTSRAWHDSSGFHASVTPEIAGITLHPAVGPDVSLPVPDLGKSITIPGVATVNLEAGRTVSGADGALATLDALKVKVFKTGTVINLAHSRAEIDAGVESRIFSGSAYGTKLDLLDGTVTSGPTPLILMPCQGTDGQLIKKNIASLDLPIGVSVHALNTSQQADSSGRTANASSTASIGRVDFGNGLVIRQILGNVQLDWARGHRMTRHANTTSPGRILFDGKLLSLPNDGSPLVIPGIASITPNVVKTIHNGLDVTALQVKILDGRAATLNLGHVVMRMNPSGM